MDRRRRPRSWWRLSAGGRPCHSDRMICILHGYLLDGSGSNLWTRAVVESLCREGETVHLVCQEAHPANFPFVAEAHRHRLDGSVETLFEREVPYPGRCVLHKPEIGETLPVYVWDRYEEFSDVVPMVDLPDEAIEAYVERNAAAVAGVVERFGVTVMHANHVVLMPVVAERVRERTGVPFVVMPHGSAIEYAVKPDPRFHRLAASALEKCGAVVCVRELRGRLLDTFPDLPGLAEKIHELKLGVDVGLFEPIPRGRRPENIRALLDAIAASPRGKTAARSELMLSALSEGLAPGALADAIARAGGYEAKLPDEDLERKLHAVDWERDRTILYVGRLIAAKGPQSILAALPLILEAHPGARLVLVGHGPLREPLEAMVWALEHGARGLVDARVERGRELEGSEGGPLETVRAFYDALESRGGLDAYFESARRLVTRDRVVFTGYLTHGELRHLFPCCDVAVFPSVVAESGPLVFLEALASGCFPIGTYFAGMAASIDSVAPALAPGDLELMKLSPEPERTVADIVSDASGALALGDRYAGALREIAEVNYDWRSIARRLSGVLRGVAARPGAG